MWSECKMHCHRFLELYITVFITQADWIIVVSDQISKTETHVCQMVKQDRVPGGAIFIMQTCCLGITVLGSPVLWLPLTSHQTAGYFTTCSL